MKKTNIRYIHTINGMPAFFDGDQICYLTRGYSAPAFMSLKEIKAQQRASKRWRKKMGYDYWDMKYSHARIAI